ncbi:hypothetical protein [uncultured Roseobacter sp.]|uniref:hypothetical protein n=1 Tax=uncultured Roseobacter sp. TaxID=114847 RepID=UPI00260FE2DC|nr:hypothetical protein [uncultured Roseobacter sp.]
MTKRCPRSADLKLLRLLDLIDHQGLSYGPAGRALGLSRSAVAGKVKRVRDEFWQTGDCACSKPENKDGGMSRGWWR